MLELVMPRCFCFSYLHLLYSIERGVYLFKLVYSLPFVRGDLQSMLTHYTVACSLVSVSMGRLYLELMLENCCLRHLPGGYAKNSRRTEKVRQSLFFEFYPLPVQTHLELFHLFPLERFKLGPNSKADPV